MKLLKKLGILILSILLLLSVTACKEKEYIPPNAQKYQYNYYPGTDWGMTEQEVMKSLGLKEKDISRESDMLDNSESMSSLQVEQKVYGYPASVIFYFDKTKISENRQTGLVASSVVFQDEFDSKKIGTFLKGELTSQGYPYNENSLKRDKPNLFIYYSSKTTLKDIQQIPIVDKVGLVLTKCFHVENLNDFIEMPISTASIETVEYDPNAQILKSCQIGFEGYIPAILNNME